MAHELGHVVLHRDIFGQVKISCIADWLDPAQNAILDVEYSWIEWQAYTFAGLILVPPDDLRREFLSMIDTAQRAGLSKGDIAGEDDARRAFESHLGVRFGVSGPVIEKRLKKDKLWQS